MKTVNNMQNVKRDDYITWDEYFIGIAKLSSMRSKDPSTQVGCCIVSKDNRILSVGYNGAPNGFDDDMFPWGRVGEKLDTKYMYVCHSELNAILNYRGSMLDLQGAKIYVRFFPCNECAKAIIQSGITRLVYLDNKYNDTEDFKESLRMLRAASIMIDSYDLLENEIIEIGDSKPL